MFKNMSILNHFLCQDVTTEIVVLFNVNVTENGLFTHTAFDRSRLITLYKVN